MLELAKTAMGLNFPVTEDDKPTNTVLKIFATIPMQGIPPGGGSNTRQFDVFQLVKMILKEAEAQGITDEERPLAGARNVTRRVCYGIEYDIIFI
jgi:hypothetical protein